MNKKQFRL